MKTLLDADYVTRGNKPILRLFYKTDNGRTIEEVGDFEPYFYAIPSGDIKDLAGRIKSLENVVDVRGKHMINLGEETTVLKVVCKQPKDVPILRVDAKNLEGCRNVVEADIPFARRYIIDSGIVPMEDAEKIGLNVAAIDIEVYNAHGEPKSGRDPITMISYADSTGLRRVWTYRTLQGINLEYVEVLENEAAVIRKLAETIRTQNIDVITGYNSDNFDMPYIKDRAEKLNVKIDLGSDGSGIHMEKRGMDMGGRITGRPHVDMYPVCRQIFNLPRYRLEDVYFNMFGLEKKDIKATDLPKYWDSKNPKELSMLFEYSMSDADITLKISLEMLPLQYELSKIVRQPLYETSRMGSGQRVEYLLMRNAFERNIIVPNRPSGEDYGDREELEPYAGAYVVEPKKGIHDNIVLFDFRSLYPSIIISHNVDPGTIDCKCCADTGYRAPNKHHFCNKKRGFIPEVLEGLISRRIEVKDRIKRESDALKKRMLDVEQNALKLLANSMYGYYGFQGSRWYCRECAEAITGWGREYIHKAMSAAEKHGFEVVYGDTDSVYLTRSGEYDKKRIMELAMKFSEDINSTLPEAMELEFEGFYPRGIFITKKRYALIDENGKLTVKGLETRRRDWAEVAKETQKDVLDAILKDRDPEKAVAIVKKRLSDIKDGRVKLADLAINTQMTRNLGDYVQMGPHVVAAKKAMKNGRDFKQGDIITYVVTRKGDSISDKAQILDFVEEGDYDPEYYINNQLLPAVMRILEALGYSEDELKGLGRQMTLDLFK